MRSPSRSDMPVKPARSMNMTLIGLHRAAEPRAVAVADQPPHQVGRNVFSERREPLRHVADRAGKISDLGQPRRMAFDLVEVETLDMPDFVDHLDQRRRDQPLRQPGRQHPANTIRTARPISSFRIVACTGPRNSDSGTTVTSDQPGNEIGVSTVL